MKVIKAPQHIDIEGDALFLAGSIEMGKAVDWQTQVTKALSNEKGTILNPRRDDWDSSWKQDIKNDQFRQQVRWELEALKRANVIAMYFDPKTQSPISLLELGLHARDSKMIVYCPEGFWRKGNVDVVCEYYKIQMADSVEDLIDQIRRRI